jgi:chromosome segregation ATPase
MRTAVKTETNMSVEERLATFESALTHARSDLAEVKSDTKLLRSELQSCRTELHTFKIDVATGFGELRAEILKTRLWMLGTAIGIVVSIVSALAGLRLH